MTFLFQKLKIYYQRYETYTMKIHLNKLHPIFKINFQVKMLEMRTG